MRGFVAAAILPLALAANLEAAELALEPCHVDGYSQEVLCGEHEVFEDRAAAQGRRIEIHFVVVPAVDEKAEPDPLVVLAGGPGQAAIDLIALVDVAFSDVRETRDVVLIDQRGVGSSQALECENFDEATGLMLAPVERLQLDREQLVECLENLDADVTRYTQDVANQDIHEITTALGYERINLYGGSWGTRSALLYAHQFPEQVRTLILDGNLPLENRALSNASADGERALDRLFDDCEADPACSRAFPDLAGSLDAVLETLGTEGQTVTLPSPTTGEPESFLLNRHDFGGALFGALYSTDLSRLVPLIIQQSRSGDYRALSALTSFFRTSFLTGDLTRGLSLTILCSEELARSEGRGGEVGSDRIGSAAYDALESACSVWPTAPLPEIYQQDIWPQAPALLLSGDLDPITPPRWGELMAERLPNSLHLVASSTGHGVAPVGCAPDLMQQFIEQGNFEGLDGSCLEELERPTFFIDASGPQATRRP